MKKGVPNNNRWNVYQDFLEAHGDDYAQVFITDTRDVIFQGNVFEAFKEQSSYLGYAAEADDIRGSKTKDKVNYNWLLKSFGVAEADKLLDKMIICDGTVIGTPAEIKVFVKKMWELLSAIDKRVNYRIHDQSIANYLIHNNLLPIENLIEINCESGEILTGALFWRQHSIDVHGDKVLRGDGEVPAVVHQYDRRDNAVKLVDRVYRDKDFRADEKYTDTRSNLEQALQLVFLDKINDALQFFTKKIAGLKDFDSNVDRLLKFWAILFKKPAFNPAIGYFELSMQNALASVKNLSVGQLNTICARLNHSVKNGRIVATQFVKFITRNLLNTAEQSFNAQNKDICAFCTETVNALPPDKNLCLLKAEAYRALGKKEEALETYKKVLELS